MHEYLKKNLCFLIKFSSHCGRYFETRFETTADGFTIWISPRWYDDEATHYAADDDTIEAIKAVSLS